MMSLLPLPNFHHFLLFLVLIFMGLGAMMLFWFFRKKEKREFEKISLKSKEDLYKVSIKLQKLGLNEEIEILLKKLEKYKYSPSSKPIPKELKDEILRVWRNNSKK